MPNKKTAAKKMKRNLKRKQEESTEAMKAKRPEGLESYLGRFASLVRGR